MWNPTDYLTYADERTRPFSELVARIPAAQLPADGPRRIVDLGCGPGNATATLARRWPAATVEALDNSPAMVEAARADGVDAWETTYIQRLTGEDPVLEWVSGTALTPVFERLDPAGRQEFRRDLAPLLREAYPQRADGSTYFPFRRVFVVATVGGADRSAA